MYFFVINKLCISILYEKGWKLRVCSYIFKYKDAYINGKSSNSFTKNSIKFVFLEIK